MSSFVGRFVLVSLLFALILAIVALVAIRRQDVQLTLLETRQASWFADAAPEEARLDAITLQPCARGACLFVQAGGREFVVGAAEGAATGLMRRGLLSANLDGVLLTGLSSADVEGLVGLRDRSLEMGRKEQLNIYGPSGVERAVEGLNALLETSDADRSIRFGVGLLPFDVAPAISPFFEPTNDSVEIFDSGVLRILMIPVRSVDAIGEVMYRFDYEEASLIVGGCGARLEDVRRATDGAKANRLLVLPAASGAQLDIMQRQAQAAGLGRASRFVASPSEFCLSAKGFANLMAETGVGRGLASPLYPSPEHAGEKRIWRREVSEATEGKDVELTPGWIWTPQIIQ